MCAMINDAIFEKKKTKTNIFSMHRSIEFCSVSVCVTSVAKQTVTEIYWLKQEKKIEEDNIFYKKKCNSDFSNLL